MSKSTADKRELRGQRSRMCQKSDSTRSRSVLRSHRMEAKSCRKRLTSESDQSRSQRARQRSHSNQTRKKAHESEANNRRPTKACKFTLPQRASCIVHPQVVLGRKLPRASKLTPVLQSAWKQGYKSFYRDPLKGYYYAGWWTNDRKNGFGHKVFGEYSYEGNFEEDEFHGFGRLVKLLPDGSADLVYEGCWADGKKAGHGRWYIPENRNDTPCQSLREVSVESGENENYCGSDDCSHLFEPQEPMSNSSDSRSRVHCGPMMTGHQTDEFWNDYGISRSSNESDEEVCCPSYLGDEHGSSMNSSQQRDQQQVAQKKVNELHKLSDFSLLTSESTVSSSPYTDACGPDPHKPPLSGGSITFQQLTQIYREFQNLHRDERKTDTWGEFVTEAKFRVRVHPDQRRVGYVPPNTCEVPKPRCPKGIFYESDNGNKICIREGESMALLKFPDLRSKKLNLKILDERNRKFYFYEGNFHNDLPSGLGFASYSDEVYYCGSWRKGQFHGAGLLVATNEFSYEGEFVDGVRQGHGTYINRQTGVSQSGFWLNGGFCQSTVHIDPQARQSAIYPAILTFPELRMSDNTVNHESLATM